MSGGSSAAGSAARLSAEPRRRLRRRLRPGPASAVPPVRGVGLVVAVLRGVLRRTSSARSAEPPACGSAESWAAVARRLRVREARFAGGWPWAPSASWGPPASSASWPAAVSSVSAPASESADLARLRLGLRLRRRPGPAPSSSALSSPGASPFAGPAGRDESARDESGLDESGRDASDGSPPGAGSARGEGSARRREAAGTPPAVAGTQPPARSARAGSVPRYRALLRRCHRILCRCSSLSSIRAISSQAPGRASPRRSARRRHAAVRTRTAREHIVSKGAGGAATAAPVSRGTRARPAALSLILFLHVMAPLHHSNASIRGSPRPGGSVNLAPAG